MLVNAGAVWWRLFQEVAAEFPEVTVDYMHIDAAMIFMTTDPARFDVIVTDNLFGDIITDLAAAITGGIGLAASGNVNPDRTAPVHVRAGARLRARHRRASRRPTRPRRSCPRRCCSTTSGTPTRPPPSRPPSSPTSPSARRAAVRRTSEVGDAIAARVAG